MSDNSVAFELILPGGSAFPVEDEEARHYAASLAEKYTTEFEFTSTSDLQDLDRVIIFELLIHGWSKDLAVRQRDGRKVDEINLSKQIREHSGELRQLKKSLGIDKVARDRARGEGSVPAYLANLRERALHFGVNREKQSAKAIELAMQAIALITVHDNFTETERRENHVEARDILDWLRTVFKPEFEAIDAHFREHDQRFWIASQ